MLAAGCSSLDTPPESIDTGEATVTTQSPSPVTFLAIGDVTDCRGVDGEVAELVNGRPEVDVLMVGDTAYPDGSAQAFEQCFDPLYGDQVSRLHAVPGDNDYGTGTAQPFFDALGPGASPTDDGWLSFSAGGWLLVGLNTNCDLVGGCGPESAQYQWLAATLESSPWPCILAFMHEPRFTSSMNYSGIPRLGDFYQLLYDHGADLLLVGHSHHYERFERLGPDGQPDPDGLANITIGIGGAAFTNFGEPLPGSTVRNNDSNGALELVLSPEGYDWRFLPAHERGSLTDSGSDRC